MGVSGNVGIALGLTIIAGLSTGIGSAIAYLVRRPRVAFLCFSLGLSAGVMIYVSFMELLPNAIERVGKIWALVFFFIGIAITGLVDLLVPEAENPHVCEGIDFGDSPAGRAGLSRIEEPTGKQGGSHLMRVGMLTALAIGIHNFPEGLATFASALSDLRLGVFITIAIAIHNIPEGIAVSVPIYYATLNRNKAFLYSFLSGLSEPVGAVIGYLILLPFLTAAVLAGSLAFAAGVMIYISLDELLPMAHRCGHGHLVIGGVVLGMLIMAVSLVML